MINENTRNDYFFSGTLKLIKVYCLFIILMTFARLAFVVYFGESNLFSTQSSELAQAFLLGWKYDTLVSSYAIVPSYLLLLIVTILKNNTLNNIYLFINQIYFFFITVLLLSILISDFSFYSYFQDHLNILFFGIIEDDTIALLETIRKNYPVEIIGIGILIFLLIIFYIFRKIFKYTNQANTKIRSGSLKFISLFTVTVVALIGGLRGGYGMMVISPKYSDFSENEFINQASRNAVVALEKTYKIRKQNNSKDYNIAQSLGYKTIQQAFSDYLGFDVSRTKNKELLHLIKRKTSKSEQIEKTKPNVVVIVMESFGANWLKYHSKDFNILGSLDKHFSEDYLFTNMISGDNGTIGSLMTIGTNIPNRPGARFLSESIYLQTPLESSANIPYLKQGYETTFMYGGKLGWRDIGRYFKYQKFDNLFGENKISKQLKLSGRQGTEWGLYDEHLFKSIEDQLLSLKRPQFILALSTSNHPPFETPKSFKSESLNIPKSLSQKILREKTLFKQRFKAFQYANDKLGEFISTIKDSELGDNTIIAVTGDHNFWGFINYTKEEAFYKHTVPLYLYIPKTLKDNIDFDPSKIISHEDIMTTLYNLSLSDVEYTSFGENVFSQGRTSAMGARIYASDSGVIYRGKKYLWDKVPYTKIAPKDANLEELEKHYKSRLSVADFFLRMSYKEKN